MAAQNVYRGYQWTQPIAFGAVATAWSTSQAYTVGCTVTNGGLTYFCLIAHTSGTFATDLASLYWILITPILWTLSAVAAGAGRISSVWDRGAGNLPERYYWFASARWVATPAAGDALRLYFIRSLALATAALTDGPLTYGDAGIAAEAAMSNNCDPIGPINVHTAADQQFAASGEVRIVSRYVGLGAWNSSATKAIITDASLTRWNYLLLVPIPPTVEASA